MDWSLFWMAALAIATFLAVVVALGLGLREGRHALQTRYDDARPVLIIVSDLTSIPVHQGNESELDWTKQPTLDVRNVGNGPAFNIKSVIYGPAAIAVRHAASASWSHNNTAKENHWYYWTADTVSQTDPPKELKYVYADLFGPNKFSEANKYIKPKDQKQKPISFNRLNSHYLHLP